LIPVTLITGFLGSGKTTLVNRLLRDPALAQSAVIINEFGEIPIDHLLVTTPAENMVVLDTGCLCCTVRGDLVQTLRDLYEKRAQAAVPAFSSVLIETSGLADPVPVVQTVVSDELLRHCYRLHDVVSVVDAVNGERQLDTQPESVKQAAVADALLITKTDLAAAEASASLRERLMRLNPAAEILEAVHGEIDPALFLRGAICDRAKPSEVERWLKVSPCVEAARGGGRYLTRGTQRHDARMSAFCVYHERPIRRAGLVMWLDMLSSLRGANLLRMKGILNVEGEPVVVHAVQSIVHEPVPLDEWPSADRRSRLVFIGRDIDRNEIERTLAALDYAPAGFATKAIDPAAYAQFVSAMRGFGQRSSKSISRISDAAKMEERE
jgi:G3E family GTPase